MSDIVTSLFTKILPDVSQIKESRLKILDHIARQLVNVIQQDDEANVVFVCTHNSRRSQIAQVCLQLFLQELNIKNIGVFSCGTEKTHIPPQIFALFKRQGLEVRESKNDSIEVFNQIVLFSKTYEDDSLPKRSIAIMVCDSASETCPFVPSFNQRISLEFRDPKQADGSPEEEKSYNKAWIKIATEMAYLVLKLDELLEK